ncbi:hypothetical protein ABKV19_008016 [Rosa sericea]
MAYLMEGETTMVVGGHRSRRKWRTTKETLDLQRPYLPIGFAVFLDLLFLYIPIINEDMKCLGLDTNRLSYSTWSILVFFFPFNKRRCLLGICKTSTFDSHNNILRNITLLYGANASKYG